MTQLQEFKNFVARHRYQVTLGEFLRSTFAAEYRKQCILLRHEGWTVNVEIDRSRTGANVYDFIPPVRIETDESGQRVFA